MKNKFMQILKITAYTGIIFASTLYILTNLKEKKKKDNHERMLLIARQINAEIRNTNRKTSPRYHEKNQEKYDKLWGSDEASPN